LTKRLDGGGGLTAVAGLTVESRQWLYGGCSIRRLKGNDGSNNDSTRAVVVVADNGVDVGR
jgi:hypothetical protein